MQCGRGRHVNLFSHVTSTVKHDIKTCNKYKMLHRKVGGKVNKIVKSQSFLLRFG